MYNICTRINILKQNNIQLSSTSTTTIAYSNGTINPIYKPEWEKVSSTIDTTNETISITIKGYANENVILSAIESRTSSPVRIPRNENGESEIKGLFPCGEGSGYAGGITTAAMDGIRVAEYIAKIYKNF